MKFGLTLPGRPLSSSSSSPTSSLAALSKSLQQVLSKPLVLFPTIHEKNGRHNRISSKSNLLQQSFTNQPRNTIFQILYQSFTYPYLGYSKEGYEMDSPTLPATPSSVSGQEGSKQQGWEDANRDRLEQTLDGLSAIRWNLKELKKCQPLSRSLSCPWYSIF